MNLRLKNVQRAYESGFALRVSHLIFRPGVTAIVGPNGAGKTTLLRLISGVDRASSGTISLDGERFSRTTLSHIGYLPQNFALPSRATVRDFLEYALWLQGVKRQDRPALSATAIESADLSAVTDRRIGQLSGGMKRRLGIAYALVHKPHLVVLDEPSAGLDPAQRVGLRNYIRTFSKQSTVIYSTHLIEEVRHLADRVVVVSGGEILFDGTQKGLIERGAGSVVGDTDLERGLICVLEGQ